MRRDSILVIVSQIVWMTLGWWVLDLGVFWPTEIQSMLNSLGFIGNLVELGVELILSYALYWTIPLFCITVFLNRCRIVIEHGLALALVNQQGQFNGSRIPTVEIRPSKLERLVFSPFLFNHHSSHHAYMTVPFYQLPKLNRLMNERFANPDNSIGYLEFPHGYLHALWTVVNHPYVAERQVS
jgi:fatty acid desaturase